MIAATNTFKTALASFRGPSLQYVITIAGYSKVFTNWASGVSGQVAWLLSIDDCTTNINDLEGGADQISLSFTVQDNARFITGSFPSFTFEGKQVTVQMGLPGLAQTDFVTLFTGFISTVQSVNSNNDYYFTCVDISAQLAQVVYPTGDNGLAISSSNPKTLLAHPLDLLTNILTVQAGIAGGFVDTTKINTYRDGVFSGLQFQFRLTQSVAAADFIKQQLLKPLGGYMWVNSLGQITVNFFSPLAAPVAVATLGPSVWNSIPEAEQVDIINTVQFQFDKDDSSPSSTNNYLAVDTEIYQPSVTKYGSQFGEQVIQADGMRSGLQGFFTARMVSRMIFGRYGFKNLKFDQAAPDSIWQTCLLEPGDVVAVTHPKVPDRVAGTLGVTGKLFEILHRTFRFNTGQMNLTMIDASYLSVFGLSQIAPDALSDFNLIVNPQALDQAPWAPNITGTATNPVVTANSVAAPDGTTTAEKIVFPTTDASSSSRYGQDLTVPGGISSALDMTAGIWLRADAPASIFLFFKRGTVLGGVAVASLNCALTTAWQRFSVHGDVNSVGTAGTNDVSIFLNQPASSASLAVYAWGAGVYKTNDIATYMFLCNNSDQYTDGEAAHVLG